MYLLLSFVNVCHQWKFFGTGEKKRMNYSANSKANSGNKIYIQFSCLHHCPYECLKDLNSAS